MGGSSQSLSGLYSSLLFVRTANCSRAFHRDHSDGRTISKGWTFKASYSQILGKVNMVSTRVAVAAVALAAVVLAVSVPVSQAWELPISGGEVKRL